MDQSSISKGDSPLLSIVTAWWQDTCNRRLSKDKWSPSSRPLAFPDSTTRWRSAYSWHVQHRPQRIASHEKEKGQHRGFPSQTECQLRAGLRFYSTTPIETGTCFLASIRHRQETHTSFFLRHLTRETVSSRSAPQTLSHCLPMPSSQPLPPEARTTGNTKSQFDIYSPVPVPGLKPKPHSKKKDSNNNEIMATT